MTAVHAIRPFRLERISQNDIWTYCHKSIYPEPHRSRPYLTWMGLQRPVPIGFRTPPGKISRCRVAPPRCPEAFRLPRSTSCWRDHPRGRPPLGEPLTETQRHGEKFPLGTPTSSSASANLSDDTAARLLNPVRQNERQILVLLGFKRVLYAIKYQ